MKAEYDAVVVGSGPNGLAAAIRLQQAGASVLVVEGAREPGGGCRTQERTLPGFHHDVCAAVHPMGIASPFLKTLPLKDHGLSWVHPEILLAHPFDGGGGVPMFREVGRTAEVLGVDSRAYERTLGHLVEHADDLFKQLLGPFRFPRQPIRLARFGMDALRPALEVARSRFQTEEARALFAGHAAHSVMPLDAPCTSAIAMMISVAGHAVGWPFVRGGSGNLIAALVGYFESLGGEVACDSPVTAMDALPKAKTYLFDTSPSGLLEIAGDRLPVGYRKRLEKFRHGAGVFKVDWALSEPIPWTNDYARRSGTVHVGGLLDEVVAAEKSCYVDRAGSPDSHGNPFVLLAQPTLCDPSRAPEGKHTAWGYCHVPSGDDTDRTALIEAQIERFAPGFSDVILERSVMNCSAYQTYNPNLIGGDVTGGLNHWKQLFTRPVARLNPYTTPAKDILLCSASTPPGGGVHGMCGYWAAEAALKEMKR